VEQTTADDTQEVEQPFESSLRDLAASN